MYVCGITYEIWMILIFRILTFKGINLIQKTFQPIVLLFKYVQRRKNSYTKGNGKDGQLCRSFLPSFVSILQLLRERSASLWSQWFLHRIHIFRKGISVQEVKNTVFLC